ncbi:tetratricopeptide repeat protein [Haloferula sargassicola]|uniref:Tetratricopeptide repeat protein n=1 Tax=Haloferula sargassicola TaxID=490096 RepID=A0ABP9UGX1_9BACT
MAEVFRHQDGLASSMGDVLGILEKWRHSPPPDDLDGAVAELEAAFRFLKGAEGSMCASVRLGLAMVLGNLHRDAGNTEQALQAYDRGAQESVDLSENPARNEMANLHTNRAIALLGVMDAARALEDLEKAIRLRESLPLDEEPVFRWGFAAGWINRGDALRMLSRHDEAVASYQRGLQELEPLEPGEAVKWRRAVAWNNRGLALRELAREEEAMASFAKSIDELEGGEEPRAVIARSAAMLHRGDDPQQVLAIVSPLERQSAEAAEVSLKARHGLARRLCDKLGGSEGDWIADATDLVEEGLELERAWETAGVESMRPVACDLFRLGLRVYRICQPQFLAEFVLESLDPEVSDGAPVDDPHFQAAAVEEVGRALRESLERGVSGERGEKELAIGKSLRAADERLAALITSRA